MIWKRSLSDKLQAWLSGRQDQAVQPAAYIDRNGQIVPHRERGGPQLGQRSRERQEQVRALLGEAMIRAGVLSGQYKSHVVMQGDAGNRVIVLVRLDKSLEHSAERQAEVEDHLVLAAGQQGIEVQNVVWIGSRRMVDPSAVTWDLGLPPPVPPQDEASADEADAPAGDVGNDAAPLAGDAGEQTAFAPTRAWSRGALSGRPGT
ncbi:hypothetical protein D8I35_14165 [Corticibacter populi]|uniref:Uncharacterized protein n=1 Tax=Corticibacter populi TaxID=1550736 RepID=A0A3M6QRF3_9BURK|nr:hypothetical protein [Corticibacter populi]RMX04992.1 hypothetical protein D8I35_14165 [Corticibacter populi]RZS33577.1 hypothetical protein EV687_1902 [Corticibacter populi]